MGGALGGLETTGQEATAMGRPRAKRMAGLVAGLVLATACTGGSDGKGPDGLREPGDDPNEEMQPEEVHENASGRLDEEHLRASIVGEDIEVLLPLERMGDGPLRGTASVELRDARAAGRGDDPPDALAEAEIDVDQDRDHDDHRLVLRGAGRDLERAGTVPLILHWKVDLPAGDLLGRRSLYAALGQVSVKLRGPTMLPPIGSSPLRVLVHDAEDGDPVEEAIVTGTLTVDDDTETLFEGDSDRDGEYLAALELPEGVNEGRVRVDVRTQDAHVWTYVEVARASDSQGVYLSADKTIYKPGQTVALRALAMSAGTREPLSDEEAVFEARDGKGNKVFRRRVDTDEFGVASVDVPTDVRINEGDWVFSVDVAGSHQELTIPVNRYNLPKMNVTVTAEAEFAMPGDTVTGFVDAFYVFGEPVANAAVTLDVRAGGRQLRQVTGTTDAAGHFPFSVDLAASLSVPNMDSTGSSLTFDAVVTDAAEQAQAGAAGIPFTKGPLLIDVVGEFGQLVPGLDNRMFVLVTDPAGRPLAADVEVDAVGEGTSQVRTDADGVAELTFRPSRSGVSMRVTATDDAGREHTRFINLGAQMGESHLAVRSDGALFGPGDEVDLTILSDIDLTRGYVDVYQGTRGVHSESIAFDDRAAELSFTVSEEMRGIVVVDAFAFTDEGEQLRASRRLLVEGTDRLQVELTAGADTYAPGAEAEVSVTVTDAFGDPQVASVGLTVVNEASFLLGGEPTSDLVRHFSFDPSSLPAELSVLKLSPESLFGGTRESRARAADLLLSEAGKAEVAVMYYDALPTEQPKVLTAVQQLVVAETSELLESLQLRVGDDGAEADTLNDLADSLARMRLDAFGQSFRVMQRRDQMVISLTSGGPDETFGTDDDATHDVNYGHLEANRVAARKRATTTPQGAMNIGFGPAPMAPAGGAAPAADFGGEPAFAGDGDGVFEGDRTLDESPTEEPAPEAAPSGPTVRKDFRETVYNNPTLITDEDGRATVSFPLAHSITSWRVSADTSTRDGKLGRGRHGFRTFQTFFVDFDVPTRLTKGDVIKLPAIVYNYLSEQATVDVSLQQESFFELVGATSQQVTLGPSEVSSVTFEVRILEAGDHRFTLMGEADGKQDAIARSALIDPDGEPEDVTFSGKLADSATHTFDLPADTVAGGGYLTLSLTPGFAAEAVSGLESMVREPNGCFEQTTATAWPNTLVANYLEQTDQVEPEQLEQIRDTVTRGYQRLLTFESPTGGINWWGDNDPGNRILSAIFLWHLKDLEDLIEIDETVRDRMVKWLVDQQQADGSWASGDELHAGNEVLGTSETRTTAFITWALGHTGWADEAVERASEYLRQDMPPMDDIYANALSANAMAIVAPADQITNDLFERLDSMKEAGDEGKISWPSDTPSWTGAAGDSAAVETTGLIAYGLMQADAYPDSVDGAINYLIGNKDSVGTWYNTQATMNALRALGAAASGGGNDASGQLEVRVNGTLVETIEITEDTNDLHREFDLSEQMVVGENDVELTYTGDGDVSYRVTRRAHRPAPPTPVGPFDLQVNYASTNLNVGDSVMADVQVTNNDDVERNQVIVRLGLAPGMTPSPDDLAALVRQRMISRYEIRGKDLVMYCMGVRGGEVRRLPVTLTATLAADASAPGSMVYAYYEPQLKVMRPAVRFNVQ
ncbi:MAG: MG2 domain-containing protein [Myxococcales bacterium]|nr:MG2 domain-containing protein [Myxococcales bacterium]